MASCLRVRLSNSRCLCRLYSFSRAGQGGWQDENSRKWNSNIITLSASSLLLVSCGTALWLNYRKHGGNNLFPSVNAAAPSISNKTRRKENAVNPLGSSSLSRLSSRERRFVQFASTEYGGQLYMTPQDFLESVIEAEPRPRLKRRILNQENLANVHKTTPSLSKGSPRLFRDLRDQGIISYTEYLFLLSILTKPKSGFRIAFNMFDTDGNARVDKQEFMVLLGVLCRKIYTEDELKGLDPLLLERIFSHAYRDRRGLLRPKSADGDEGEDETQQESVAAKKIKYQDQEALNALDEGLQRRHEIDTTLLVHLFGKSGTRELTYEQFSAFMENLQTEVLEMEFLEFSKGLATITELDFAKILLRYTQLDPDTYDEYLDRLLESDAEEKGITFPEFLVFCTFLNNLEDFAVAMRMYSLADRPISEDEFQRAVKICTGSSLSPHLVRTVFLLFDEDGDGRLSDREFVAIMRDRIHRGLKSYTRSEGWEAFKHCIKQEMKSAI